MLIIGVLFFLEAAASFSVLVFRTSTLIMDAYEIIKNHTDNGFPKTRLQSFHMDGDITKLAICSSQLS